LIKVYAERIQLMGNTLKSYEQFNEQAVWKDDRYVVEEQGWFSLDGDTWTEMDGNPIESDTFDTARILLVGGPRGGAIVS
jgi:hypothetical protein